MTIVYELHHHVIPSRNLFSRIPIVVVIAGDERSAGCRLKRWKRLRMKYRHLRRRSTSSSLQRRKLHPDKIKMTSPEQFTGYAVSFISLALPSLS